MCDLVFGAWAYSLPTAQMLPQPVPTFSAGKCVCGDQVQVEHTEQNTANTSYCKLELTQSLCTEDFETHEALLIFSYNIVLA